MPSPFMIIKSCKVVVTKVDFVDVDLSSAGFTKVPIITASAVDNLNLFVSNVTKTSARINFSQIYTGTIFYTAITTEAL